MISHIFNSLDLLGVCLQDFQEINHLWFPRNVSQHAICLNLVGHDYSVSYKNPGTTAHTSNSSTWEPEAGLYVWGQPALHSETLSQQHNFELLKLYNKHTKAFCGMRTVTDFDNSIVSFGDLTMEKQDR